MASLIVRKLDASAVILDDIGLTITGPLGTTFDLITEEAQDITMSADLVAAIGVTLEVLDPRDGATLLSTADGILAIQNHNLPHFGIAGGRFDAADTPSSSFPDNWLLEYDLSSDEFIPTDPAAVISNSQSTIGDIIGGMGQNGGDTTFNYDPTDTWLVDGRDETTFDGTDPNGTFSGGDGAGGTAYAPGDTITLSDGSVITVDAVDGNGDVTDFTVTTSGETNVTPGTPLTQTSSSGTGTSFTLTPELPNITPGSVNWSVNDSFLRNDGDTLDSGTLTVASGASINIASGGDLTIQDQPVNGTDAVNKDYVDSVASGLDPKESVRYFTVNDLGGSYNATGGTGGAGELTVDTTTAANFDGLTAGALVVGDRILVKSQTDPLQNGIYVVTTTGVSGTLERAEDHDGSPNNEVSGGNYTLVENGATGINTAWVLQGDGNLTLNTDNISWVKYSESTAINAGVAMSQGGTNFDVDVAQSIGAATSTGADLLLFHDQDGTAASSGSGSQTYHTTIANFLGDNNVVNNVAGTGFLVQTAPNTYTSVSITAAGLGDRDGISVVNGNGAGVPTIGLDIEGLPVQTAISVTDRIAVWDASADANVYYTVGDVAGALSSVNSFETWTGAGNTTGDASIIADSATDTVTLSGGDGINIDLTSSSDTITLSLSSAGMADTAVTSSDLVPFFDASNSNEPEYRSWSDIISDLGIATNIAASTNEDLLGINVTGSDIGLDIDGLTDPAEDMSATDEFPVHNKSEGTAGANRKMSGQNVADGVADILNIGGITVSTINGQPVVTFIDDTRGNKILSIDSNMFSFGENNLVHLDWIRPVGSATDADSGYIMPLDGTIVFATAHCENTSGADSKDLHLFVNGTDSGSLGTLAGGANVTFNNTTVNIDFSAGDRIRLQAQGSATGNIEDTVASVHVRWRA